MVLGLNHVFVGPAIIDQGKQIDYTLDYITSSGLGYKVFVLYGARREPNPNEGSFRTVIKLAPMPDSDIMWWSLDCGAVVREQSSRCKAAHGGGNFPTRFSLLLLTKRAAVVATTYPIARAGFCGTLYTAIGTPRGALRCGFSRWCLPLVAVYLLPLESWDHTVLYPGYLSVRVSMTHERPLQVAGDQVSPRDIQKGKDEVEFTLGVDVTINVAMTQVRSWAFNNAARGYKHQRSTRRDGGAGSILWFHTRADHIGLAQSRGFPELLPSKACSEGISSICHRGPACRDPSSLGDDQVGKFLARFDEYGAVIVTDVETSETHR
ncbi:hypothetical protein EDB89DRAFT_1906863 [Lactarius sanguifluus]|nr:hypothetical protein EDB89DRAFT_1906863 [Lactarius sanguifluus]